MTAETISCNTVSKQTNTVNNTVNKDNTLVVSNSSLV